MDEGSLPVDERSFPVGGGSFPIGEGSFPIGEGSFPIGRRLVELAKRRLVHRARRGLVVTVGVAGGAMLLASCASTPDVSLARRPGVPSAPIWQGAGAVDVATSSTPETPTSTWLVAPYPASTSTGPGGNARPDWIVYRLGEASASQVTPPGVVVRGGVAVSALSKQVAWVGMGSYRFDLDGNVAVTTDGGRRWSQNVLPYPYRPAPGGIVAQSAGSAIVLAGTASKQIVVQSTNSGVTWHELASAGELLGPWRTTCSLEGLGQGTDGALVVGSRCRSGTGVIVVRTAAGDIERFTVAPSGDSGALTSVTSVPQPVASAASSKSTTSARSVGALVGVIWSKPVGGGQLAGVVALPATAGSVSGATAGSVSGATAGSVTGATAGSVTGATAGSPTGATADPLPLDGTPAAVPAGYSTVAIAASGARGPQALLLADDPTNWSHLGPVRLQVRDAPGEPWTPATVDDGGGHPDALAWVTRSASGGGSRSGSGIGTLVVSGSTARGVPSAWTVSLGFPGAGAGPPRALWKAMSLAVPRIPTAKSLS